jgi:hypothetical protein
MPGSLPVLGLADDLSTHRTAAGHCAAFVAILLLAWFQAGRSLVQRVALAICILLLGAGDFSRALRRCPGSELREPDLHRQPMNGLVRFKIQDSRFQIRPS